MKKGRTGKALKLIGETEAKARATTVLCICNSKGVKDALFKSYVEQRLGRGYQHVALERLNNTNRILMKFSDDRDASMFFNAEARKGQLFFVVDVDDKNELTGQYRFADGKGKILKGNLDKTILELFEKNWDTKNSALKQQILQALMNPSEKKFLDQVKESLAKLPTSSSRPSAGIVARVSTAKPDKPILESEKVVAEVVGENPHCVRLGR